MLELTIDQFFKLPMQHDNHFRDVWCEVSTEKGFVRSEMNEISTLEPYKFTFPLESPLIGETVLRLYTCHSLESELLG